MEFNPGTENFLVIKIRTERPSEFDCIKSFLPLFHKSYQKRFKVLSLAFRFKDEKEVEGILEKFLARFPKVNLVETALSPFTTKEEYTIRLSDNITITNKRDEGVLERGHIYLRSLLSFGSGFHPTTRICISLLEEVFSKKDVKNVFDLGTGSGILALSAARLGARHVVAVDISFDSCLEALENVKANGLEKNILIVRGTYSCVKDKGFDLVMANLTASLLSTMGDKLLPMLRHDGLMILSGFSPIQVPYVKRLIGPFKITKIIRENGWAGVLGMPSMDFL